MADFTQYYRSRKRWLKEQQIIHKNYQISSNTSHLSTLTFHRPIPNHEKIVVNNGNHQSKHDPPMFCPSCYLHLTQCVCTDGLGQWWANSKEQTQSASSSTDILLQIIIKIFSISRQTIKTIFQSFHG